MVNVTRIKLEIHMYVKLGGIHMYVMRYALRVMRHASCVFCESICTYIRNALRVCIMLFDQEHVIFLSFWG